MKGEEKSLPPAFDSPHLSLSTMIQKTQGRRLDLSTSQHNANDHFSWGQWVHDKHYSLQVVQHPSRARMCGFGDKDRRPLAPAAVAKMIVRDRNDNIVPVDDVDVNFFVVTVDLWSEEGSQEMNLVLHPSSADRYVPANMPRPKRTKTSGSVGGRSAMGSPVLPSASFGPLTSNTTPISTSFDSYPFPPPSASSSNSTHTSPTHNLPPPLTSATSDPGINLTSPYPHSSSWNYPSPRSSTGSGNNNSSHHQQQHHLPSIQSLKDAQEGASSYRAWSGDGDVFLPDPPSLDLLPELYYTYPPPSAPSSTSNASYPQSHSAPPPPPPNSYYSSTTTATPRPLTPANLPQLPRHTYTRTLVGPLSANACRLQDEHRKSGIFFLFQDLSVRTEGTFRLRMRLMCVGAPPAPEWGSNSVTHGIVPVLAQTYTESFVVYSAKRFPGVPDTTALSIAFGNQGQKLPLRNRHGSARPRGRGRAESDDDDDD